MNAIPNQEQHSTVIALDRQLEASLRDIGIPPRPRILELIKLESRADEPDFNYMAELISSDVALAAGLIKTANSPFFGYRQKARHVRDALIMLGMRAASNAVAGLVLRRVFPLPPQLIRFWDASERTAQLVGWLVQEVGVRFGVSSEEAYTFALFRDCGIPIMLRRFTGYSETLAKANNEAERPFTDVEEDDTPTNHAVVGALMAQTWWLPEEISTAIRRHHDASTLVDGGASGACGRHVALAQVAEKLHQEISGLNMTHEWNKLGADSLQLLGLGDRMPDELVSGARSFIKTLAEY